MPEILRAPHNASFISCRGAGECRAGGGAGSGAGAGVGVGVGGGRAGRAGRGQRPTNLEG